MHESFGINQNLYTLVLNQHAKMSININQRKIKCFKMNFNHKVHEVGRVKLAMLIESTQTKTINYNNARYIAIMKESHKM